MDYEQFSETLREHGEAFCPCCRRTGRLSEHRIDQHMIHMLRLLSAFGKLTPKRWAELAVQHGFSYAANANRSKLAYWNLAVRVGPYWYITGQGQAFLDGKHRIPEYVETFNREVRYFSKQTISIEDV